MFVFAAGRLGVLHARIMQLLTTVCILAHSCLHPGRVSSELSRAVPVQVIAVTSFAEHLVHFVVSGVHLSALHLRTNAACGHAVWLCVCPSTYTVRICYLVTSLCDM